MPSSAPDIPAVDQPPHYADTATRQDVTSCLNQAADLTKIVTEICACIRATPMDGWRLVQTYYHTLNQEMRRQCWDNPEIKQAFEESMLLAAKNLQGQEMYRIWQVANLYGIDLMQVLFEKVGEMLATELRQAIQSGNTDRVNDVLTFIQQPNNGLSEQIYMPQLANGLRGIFDNDEQYAQAIASGITQRFMRSYGYSAATIRSEFHFISNTDMTTPHVQAALALMAEKYRHHHEQHTDFKKKHTDFMTMCDIDISRIPYDASGVTGDAYKLLMHLGAWEHSATLIHEIRRATADGVDICNEPSETLKQLCMYYASKPSATQDHSRHQSALDILNNMPIVSNRTRQSNIAQVNARQNVHLQKSNLGEIHPDNMEHRTLVLYYRSRLGRDNMDSLEFLVALQAAQMYIESGRAQVFDQIQIVSREPNVYPPQVHQICPTATYLNVSGQKFITACNIGANTVTFTHSNTSNKKYNSVSILGAAVRMSAEKMSGDTGPYVDMQCDWDTADFYRNKSLKLNEPNYAGSIPGIMYEMIRCIKAAEDMMLADAGLPPRTSPPEVAEAVAQ